METIAYQAILFDMDGVLIDTYQSVTAFWEDVAALHQARLSPVDFSRDIYGCPASHTLEVLFPQLDSGQQQRVLDKLVHYEANLTYTPVKGVMTLLQTLQENNIPTALVTSGDRHKVSQVSDQLNLNGLFLAQVTVDDIRQGKPHPECYRLAAQRLRIPPEQCLVFEDSVSGVKAAVAAGMTCIGLRPEDTAKALVEVGAGRVIPDFAEVRLLSGQNSNQAAPILQIDAKYAVPLIAQVTLF